MILLQMKHRVLGIRTFEHTCIVIHENSGDLDAAKAKKRSRRSVESRSTAGEITGLTKLPRNLLTAPSAQGTVALTRHSIRTLYIELGEEAVSDRYEHVPSVNTARKYTGRTEKEVLEEPDTAVFRACT